jgi:hypothetical protein
MRSIGEDVSQPWEKQQALLDLTSPQVKVFDHQMYCVHNGDHARALGRTRTGHATFGK